MLLITSLPSPPHALNYLPAKSAERRGRSCGDLRNLLSTKVRRPQGPVLCRPTDNVRHIFLKKLGHYLRATKNVRHILNKEVGTLFEGRHKTGPCEASVSCGTRISNAYKWFHICSDDGCSHLQNLEDSYEKIL